MLSGGWRGRGAAWASQEWTAAQQLRNVHMNVSLLTSHTIHGSTAVCMLVVVHHMVLGGGGLGFTGVDGCTAQNT
jgi:hypothetical protein